MKIRLCCTYFRPAATKDQRPEKLGEPGQVLELPKDEALLLLRGGSAELIEPPKKSERD
jgi:hypothetical protein